MPGPHHGRSVALGWVGERGRRWREQLPAMEAMLAPVDAPLIEALRLEAPCRVVDLGCGGGGATLELWRRAPRGSVVHGFDRSPALVQVARQRMPAGAVGLGFDVADMGRPPPAEPYHRLVARFSAMFFEQEAEGFANLARWLSPGGSFVLAVWGPPEDNPWLSSVRRCVEQVVSLPALGAREPGPFRYAQVEALLELLRGAGLEALEVRDWRGTLPLGGGRSALEAARFALTTFVTFSEVLEAAGAPAIDEALRRVTALLTPHERGGVVRLGARVHLVTGSAPR